MAIRQNVTSGTIKFALQVAFLCTLFFGNPAIANTFTHYKLGVFPFMPMSALVKYFNSVGMDLTRQLDKRVIAQTRSSFDGFSKEIEKETYDIIFIQPFDYPAAYKHNYRPLARRGANLDVILLTTQNSKIQSINDIPGKKLANPPKGSAVSIIINKEFKKLIPDKLDTFKMIYTRNHFACIQMVLVGQADVCNTTTPVLYHWQNSGMKKGKLRIIHKTESVPHSLYMAHRRVPEKDQKKIREAILTWDKRPEGMMILRQFSLQRFVEATNSDYDVIRNF